MATCGSVPHPTPSPRAKAASPDAPLAARGQNPPGIRASTHPRWIASLCVAPRANSAAIPPSSRLAGAAPRRSRCSGGFIHGLGFREGIRPAGFILRSFLTRCGTPSGAIPPSTPVREIRECASLPYNVAGLPAPIAHHHGRVDDQRQPLRGPARERPAPPDHVLQQRVQERNHALGHPPQPPPEGRGVRQSIRPPSPSRSNSLRTKTGPPPSARFGALWRTRSGCPQPSSPSPIGTGQRAAKAVWPARSPRDQVLRL